MKILKVLPNDVSEDCPEVAQLRRHGNIVETMRPALWSALTAASVASRLKGFGADRVEVERLKDAVAAVSARKLVPDIRFEIAVRVPRNSEPWRHVSRIEGEAIRWIYPSERLRTAFGISGVTEPLDIPCCKESGQDTPMTRLAFFGDDAPATYMRLKEAAEAIAATPDAILDVYGEFKARYVMPIVRRCRALEIENRVAWHGKDYDFNEAVKNCDRVLLSQHEPTDTELQAACFGKPLTDRI